HARYADARLALFAGLGCVAGGAPQRSPVWPPRQSRYARHFWRHHPLHDGRRAARLAFRARLAGDARRQQSLQPACLGLSPVARTDLAGGHPLEASMKTFKQVVVLLLAMVVAAPALAHHDMQMGAEPAVGASAAFAPDGRSWVVTAHDGYVWLRHSDDFGKTLSRPVAVNDGAEAISAEGENRPKIALGPQGEIYVSWTHPLPKPWTGFIRFARSLDGGKHFSAPITVHHDR